MREEEARVAIMCLAWMRLAQECPCWAGERGGGAGLGDQEMGGVPLDLLSLSVCRLGQWRQLDSVVVGRGQQVGLKYRAALWMNF